jgi:hypothetical protein
MIAGLMLAGRAMIADVFYNSFRTPHSAFRNRIVGGMGGGMGGMGMGM